MTTRAGDVELAGDERDERRVLLRRRRPAVVAEDRCEDVGEAGAARARRRRRRRGRAAGPATAARTCVAEWVLGDVLLLCGVLDGAMKCARRTRSRSPANCSPARRRAGSAYGGRAGRPAGTDGGPTTIPVSASNAATTVSQRRPSFSGVTVDRRRRRRRAALAHRVGRTSPSGSRTARCTRRLRRSAVARHDHAAVRVDVDRGAGDLLRPVDVRHPRARSSAARRSIAYSWVTTGPDGRSRGSGSAGMTPADGRNVRSKTSRRRRSSRRWRARRS